MKCNQSPSDIVRAFVGKKIADEMAAASRDDTAPILGIFPELILLAGIDLIADHACNRHGLLIVFGSVESQMPCNETVPTASTMPIASRLPNGRL